MTLKFYTDYYCDYIIAGRHNDQERNNIVIVQNSCTFDKSYLDYVMIFHVVVTLHNNVLRPIYSS